MGPGFDDKRRRYDGQQEEHGSGTGSSRVASAEHHQLAGMAAVQRIAREGRDVEVDTIERGMEMQVSEGTTLESAQARAAKKPAIKTPEAIRADMDSCIDASVTELHQGLTIAHHALLARRIHEITGTTARTIAGAILEVSVDKAAEFVGEMIEAPAVLVWAVVEAVKKTREVVETSREMSENEETLLDVLKLIMVCETRFKAALEETKTAIRKLPDRAAIERNGTFQPGQPLFHRQVIEGAVLGVVVAEKLDAARTVHQKIDAIKQAQDLGQEMAQADKEAGK
jgi:hypothetical protein